MIRFQSIYGLCNRLRGIVGAVELARITGRELEIYWINDKDLPADFTDLFENIRVSKSKMIKTKLPLVYNTSTLGNLFLPKIIRTFTKQKIYSEHKIHSFIENGGNVTALAAQHRIFNYKSYLNICYVNKGYDIFQPIVSIQRQIDEISKQFNKHTYGVHIRRTDNGQSIASSPDELFVNKIKSIISLNPSSSFYVASDDLIIKKFLISQFGDKIITNTEEVNRNSVKDIERAVIELYALSKTRKIFGSYWSSFSETASYIGNIELEMLKKTN